MKTALRSPLSALRLTKAWVGRLARPHSPDVAESGERRAESASAASPEPPPLTPTQLAWRQLRKNRFALAGGAILFVLYTMALFADILSPYPTDLQRRELFYHPPTLLRWRDASGAWLWRPHVAATKLALGTAERTFVDDPNEIGRASCRERV